MNASGTEDKAKTASTTGSGRVRAFVTDAATWGRRKVWKSVATVVFGPVAFLVWPVFLIPFFAWYGFRGVDLARRAGRHGPHPSQGGAAGRPGAAERARREALQTFVFAMAGLSVVGWMVAWPIVDAALVWLLKILLLVLVLGVVLLLARARFNESSARVEPSLTAVENATVVRRLLQLAGRTFRWPGLVELVFPAEGESGPASGIIWVLAVMFVACAGAGGHVDPVATELIGWVPEPARSVLERVSDRISEPSEPGPKARAPQSVSGSSSTTVETAEQRCGFNPSERLHEGVPAVVGAAMTRVWSREGAVEGGCPGYPQEKHSLWIAELSKGVLEGSFVVSDATGRAAVVFGNVGAKIRTAIDGGLVLRVGRRLDVGQGDVQLVERRDGTCELIGRFTKDDPYIHVPGAVTAAAAPRRGSPIALPKEAGRDRFTFERDDSRTRFVVEYDRAGNRARVVGPDRQWTVPNPPCPRAELAALVPE